MPDTAPRTDQPPVAVVMCTYQGAKWLPAQLDSLARQDYRNWSLFVSDDGSDDGTVALLEDFARDHPVQIVTPQMTWKTRTGTARVAAHFMATLMRSDLPVGPDTIVALSDQDDIWRPTKMSHGVAALRSARGQAALYGGQSRHVDEWGNPLRFSKAPLRPVGLRNALVQNVVSGHSLMMTPQALAVVRQAGLPEGIHHHDWWLYLLLSAHGAQVIVDDFVGLDYRQHGSNILGAGQGVAARKRRLGQIFDGTFGAWVQANTAALSNASTKRDVAFSDEAKVIIDHLSGSGGRITPADLIRSGAYRQDRFETLFLWSAAALGRL